MNYYAFYFTSTDRVHFDIWMLAPSRNQEPPSTLFGWKVFSTRRNTLSGVIPIPFAICYEDGDFIAKAESFEDLKGLYMEYFL